MFPTSSHFNACPQLVVLFWEVWELQETGPSQWKQATRSLYSRFYVYCFLVCYNMRSLLPTHSCCHTLSSLPHHDERKPSKS